MKRLHIAAILLMSLMMMAVMTCMASAEDFSFEGECQYNGSKITSSFTTDEFAASQAGLEPGDSLKYTVTYTNKGSNSTLWYMRNSVLETLEDAKSQAENGGYTYVLKNIGPDGKETVLFDNSEVGGETKTSDLEGLKQATNATGNFFYIQKLKPGESGTTTLYVGMDGETEVNDYLNTKGALMVSYAVEDEGSETSTEQDTTSTSKDSSTKNRSNNSSHPRTGDTMELLKVITIMAAALLAAILAIISWRRDRKKEEPAAEGAGGSGKAGGKA